MKKTIFILPFLLLMLASCVDSELVIPGENVGNGDTGDTTNSAILQTYALQHGNVTSNFQFNEAGKVTQISEAGGSFDYTYIFTYTDSKVTQLTTNNFGDTTYTLNVTYDDTENITTLANEDDTFRVDLVNSGNGFIAALTLNNEETPAASTVMAFDASNRVLTQSITVTGGTFSTAYQPQYISGNATTLEAIINGTSQNSISFSYDDKSNPLFSQLQTESKIIALLNALGIIDLIRNEQQGNAQDVQLYAKIYSQNNVTNQTEGDSVTNYAYSYNDNDLPASASITDGDDSTETGTITYTYY